MTPIAASADRIEKAVADAYEDQKTKRGGAIASYIPALAKVNRELFDVPRRGR